MTLRDDVLSTLVANPEGLTAGEVARKLGIHVGSVGSTLHRDLLIGKVHNDGIRENDKGYTSRIFKYGPRPDGEVEAPRSVRIVAHVTPDEHRRIYAAATKKGLHPASFMRAVAVEASNA